VSKGNGSAGSQASQRTDLTVDDLWVVGKAMLETLGLSNQHINSFNRLVTEKIPEMVRSLGPIYPSRRQQRRKKQAPLPTVLPRVEVEFVNIRFGQPQAKGARVAQKIYPIDSRIRNISYTAPLLAEVVLRVNGVEKDRREVKIADFPVMIKSVIDPLSRMTEEELISIGEDPYDPGGYFIINGSEKVVVIQEDLAVNRIIVGPSTASTSKITHTAKVVSTKLGLRRQVIVDRMSDGSLEVTVSRLNARIPFVVFMRALGLEKEILISYAVSPDEDVQRELLPSFEKVATIQTREEALEYIGNRLASGQPREKRLRRAEEFLDKEFLPHLGDRPEDRIKKALFLAEMANRVLQLYLGKRKPDDKDHYANKRVRLAGDLIAEIFRDALYSLANSISQSLETSLAQMNFNMIRLNTLIKSNVITDKLRTALATGNWGRDRTGVSQALDRTNWISLLSHLRRVISPLSRGQVHLEARDLHGTHWGRLCPFETPEGINCGLVKNLALMAYISVGVDETGIEDLLVKEMGVVPLTDLLNEILETGEPPEVMLVGAKVFLNGRPVGYHAEPEKLVETLRQMRRRGELSFEVSVAHIKDEYINEVYINTDEGRVMRPLVIVENGKPKLTKQHIEWLAKGERDGKKYTFWDLVREGVIEFVDPDEEENIYVAERLWDVNEEHTHMELWVPAIVGVSAATIPYLDHNQSPRNTYQAAMAKQSLGLYALNYMLRTDSHSYLLHYPQKPIVQTRMLGPIGYNDRPAGQNMVVALMAYSGYNIEDALIFNKTSVDFGLARAHFMRVYTATQNVYPGGTTDEIRIPEPNLIDHKGDEFYRKLAPDGIVDPGVEVRGGDVLVGRVSPPRFIGEERVVVGSMMAKRDTSIQLRYGEKGIVDTVILTQTIDGLKLVKVKVRDQRIPEIGDKFASRHGQKGVIGILIPRYDMPYTEEGITPDVILNPHAIPSRMTVGQLLENIAGKLGALEARYVDGTPFYKEDIEAIRLSLVKHGYDPNAREIMYDGRNGRIIEKPVTIGITFTQRLYHMVADKMHARATGKVQLLTRQPTEGKARQGGLRFGEMERDCLIGHGAAALLRDRMLFNSDMYEMLVCNKCGHISWYNRKRGVYECPIHDEDGDVKPVIVPYAFKLLVQEITSMVIKPRLIVDPKIDVLKKLPGYDPRSAIKEPQKVGGGDGKKGDGKRG